MNRGFWYLVLVTLVVVITVFYLAQRDESKLLPGTQAGLLLPELHNVINDVDHVNVVTAGNTVVASLNKSGGQWQVEQMSSYAANWPVLQKVLSALARAKVVEVKTDKPEYYSRIGVQDLASENADGVMLELSANDKTQSVIIGHQAKSRLGQYVRLQDSAASALVDQSMDMPVNLMGWVDKRIIDISSAEVAQVEIIHPDRQRVLVMRISADQKDFDLADKPADRELRSTWAVNSLAGSLALLDLKSVMPANGDDWSAAVKMRVLLFSGVEIMADLLNKDDEYLLRLKASKPDTDFEARVDAQDEDEVKKAETAVKQQVADINQRVNGWVYSIPKAKYETMTRVPEDLLKPVEPTEPIEK